MIKKVKYAYSIPSVVGLLESFYGYLKADHPMFINGNCKEVK